MVDFMEFRRLLERRVGGEIQVKWDRLLQAVEDREALWYCTLENKLQTHLFLLRLDDLRSVHYRIYRHRMVTAKGWLIILRLDYDE